MNYFEQVNYAFDNLKHFISNNSDKIPDYFREWLIKFINFLGKIINVNFGNTKLDYAIYKEEQNEKAFYKRQWILK